jgi:hypothetical protein
VRDFATSSMWWSTASDPPAGRRNCGWQSPTEGCICSAAVSLQGRLQQQASTVFERNLSNNMQQALYLQYPSDWQGAVDVSQCQCNLWGVTEAVPAVWVRSRAHSWAVDGGRSGGVSVQMSWKGAVYLLGVPCRGHM